MSRRHSIFRFSAIVNPAQKDALAKAFSYQRITAINRKVSDFLVRKFASYIYERSKTRHKTADRLNAPHTGVLEFSRGSNPSYTRRGGKIFGGVEGGSAFVKIQGVAGLARAVRALDIYPKKAKALTIPIAAESYAKTARKLSDSGWFLFIPKRKQMDGGDKGVLMGRLGGVTKPLYLLRRHVHVRHDHNLLPSSRMIAEWTAQGINEYMEAANL